MEKSRKHLVKIWSKFSKILGNFAKFCKNQRNFQRFLTKILRLENGANVAFVGFCHSSLPFLALLFVRFFCRRLFAKFFDLRSWLSVSLPLRSVGTPSPPNRESCFFQPRNNLEPCTDSLELCRRVWHRRKSEQRTFG